MAMYSTYGVHRLNLIHSACAFVVVVVVFSRRFICRGWQTNLLLFSFGFIFYDYEHV